MKTMTAVAGADNHLQMLVSRIKGPGEEYVAQLLSQSDVDAPCDVSSHTPARTSPSVGA